MRKTNLRWLAKNLDFLRVPLNAVERADREGSIPYWGANGIVDHVDQALLDERVVLIGEDGAPFFEREKDVAFVSEGPIWPNNHIHILKPDPKSIDDRYLCYFLNQVEYAKYINGSTRDKLTQSQLGSILVSYPDLVSQISIADFLDRETNHIDHLIKKKLRLSNLLEEKLTDDNLRAVTLGLEPDVELVPEDDLEWTANRPRHWRMVRLKYLFRENTQYSSDGTETLLSLRMNEGLVPHNDVSDKELLPDDLIGYKKVLPGQIVMNRMRAAIGLFGLANNEGIVSPDYSIFNVNREAHAGYFLRLFKTEPMKAAFRLLSKGLGTGHSGFMRLNSDNFGKIRVAVPGFEEQVEISRYVEARIQQVNALGNKNKISIDRLKEFRFALVTAAVMGQIDVETWGKQGQTERRLDQIEEELALREARG